MLQQQQQQQQWRQDIQAVCKWVCLFSKVISKPLYLEDKTKLSSHEISLIIPQWTGKHKDLAHIQVHFFVCFFFISSSKHFLHEIITLFVFPATLDFTTYTYSVNTVFSSQTQRVINWNYPDNIMFGRYRTEKSILQIFSPILSLSHKASGCRSKAKTSIPALPCVCGWNMNLCCKDKQAGLFPQSLHCSFCLWFLQQQPQFRCQEGQHLTYLRKCACM